jgi:hypothetical protein
MAKPQTKLNERRVYVRRLVNARVKLTHGTIGDVRGKTRDISDSGVFVVLNPVPKLPIGSHVKMYMLDSKQPDIAFNMKVVRSTGEGVGLMFIDYEFAGQRYSMDVLRKQLRK